MDPVSFEPVATHGPGAAGPARIPAIRVAGGELAQLDAFARASGPDVRLDTDAGPVAVHAVFQVEPGSGDLQAMVVDETGRLIRMIPPESVAQMLAAMAAYRRKAG